MKIVHDKRKGIVDPIEWEPYIGETVIVRTVIKGGKKTHETAYYEDKVKAVPTGNAYCIGNGPSRKGFDLNLLKSSGQTYGCNALYRDFSPDFLFMVDSQMTKEIVDNKVDEKCICYAPSLEVNRYPNSKLNLIPYNQHYTSGNQAIWTAAVHGHKNIYLIGFDFREYGNGEFNNIYQDSKNYGKRNSDTVFVEWFATFRKMIKQRPYCNFIIVHDNPPDYLNYTQTGVDLGNTKLITYNKFIETILN
jgi:hypothetical protein